MKHQFARSKQRGDWGERVLDNLLKTRYFLENSRILEKQGIDRIATCLQTGARFYLEYKTDYAADKTGNAFIETISSDTDASVGWAIRSKSRSPDLLLASQWADLHHISQSSRFLPA